MVLPVYDDNPTHRPAYVTGVILALNVVVFLLSPARWPLFGAPSERQSCHQKAFAQRYGALPDELIHLRPRHETYALGPDHHCHLVATGDHKHAALSLLTYMFVHGSLLHLLGNMLFLGIFGNNVEDRLGRVRYLIFYLAAGVVSGYGFAFTRASSNAPLVGASGAIAGILGAYLVLYPKARITGLLFYLVPLRLPAWVVLGLWFTIQAAYARSTGLAGGDVAYLVHAIGFVFGALYVLVARRHLPEHPHRLGHDPPRPPRRPVGAGWILARHGWLLPLFLVYDPDGCYVGEIQRLLTGGWQARNGWDDDAIPLRHLTRDGAFAELRRWWDSTGRFLWGPSQRDPSDD